MSPPRAMSRTVWHCTGPCGFMTSAPHFKVQVLGSYVPFTQVSSVSASEQLVSLPEHAAMLLLEPAAEDPPTWELLPLLPPLEAPKDEPPCRMLLAYYTSWSKPKQLVQNRGHVIRQIFVEWRA